MTRAVRTISLNDPRYRARQPHPVPVYHRSGERVSAMLPAPYSEQLSALPQELALALYQGDDFFLTVTVTDPDGGPVSLHGYTAAAQIRAGPADDHPVMAEFVALVNGDTIQLQLRHEQATMLHGGLAAWDMQTTDPNGVVLTLLAGDVQVVPEITAGRIGTAPVDLATDPDIVNLAIYEGDDYPIDVEVFAFDGSPVDLTEWGGATPRAEIRQDVNAETVLAEFDASIDPVETNRIHLWLRADVNTDMPTSAAVWDCQISHHGRITTLCAGTVRWTQEVTRP